MALLNRHIIFILFSWVTFVVSAALSSNNMFFTDASGADIADYISSKKYIPNKNELPRLPLIKNVDNDAMYLLSRLSDEELLKLLNDQPQKEDFGLNDIVKIALNAKNGEDNIYQYQEGNPENKRFRYMTNKDDKMPAYYRLNHKVVDQQFGKNDMNYNALQKLKGLLHAFQETKTDEIYNDENDEKKALLFDILTAQLKSLCCKKNQKSGSKKGQNKALVKKILPPWLDYKTNQPNQQYVDIRSKEYMFLILNDEIKSNGNDELLSVDPESLDGNSSVLLLGPVETPLSDDQLKLVMNRISNELAKPEYYSLLQQLADKAIKGNNRNIIKSFIFGPETRRYMKPHRCNHQSKLAKVYGGPKWIICTGYLNLNKPSLYD